MFARCLFFRFTPAMTVYDTSATGTKLKILLAAQSILETSGYAGLNTNRIASAAKLSVGAIYRYFRTKDDILWHISRLRIESLLRVIQKASTSRPEDGHERTPLGRVLDAYAHHYQLSPRLNARIIRIEQELGQPVEIQNLYQQFLQYLEVAASSSNIVTYHGMANDIVAVADGLLSAQRQDNAQALPIAVRIERISHSLIFR